MIKNTYACWCSLGAACLLLFSSAFAATTFIGTYGTGKDVVYVSLESPTWGIRHYKVRFDYSATNAFDGYDAFNTINLNDPDITLNWQSSSFGQYLKSIQLAGYAKEENSSTAPYVYWAQWVAGGKAGHPVANDVPFNSWTFGSGVSAPYRIITPGSNEVFVFGTGAAPSFNPIPEPSFAMVLLVAGGAVFLKRKRN